MPSLSTIAVIIRFETQQQVCLQPTGWQANETAMKQGYITIQCRDIYIYIHTYIPTHLFVAFFLSFVFFSGQTQNLPSLFFWVDAATNWYHHLEPTILSIRRRLPAGCIDTTFYTPDTVFLLVSSKFMTDAATTQIQHHD